MADSKRDENRVPTITGVLNSDGTTIVPIQIDPTTHALTVGDGTSGSDNGPSGGNALRDNNRVPVLMAVSESDGTTPVPIYADSSGSLLIDSN